MSSKKEALNKRVRETISSLSDEALQNLVEHSPIDYTPYALQIAREELKKRKKLKSLRADDRALQQTSDEKLRTGCYVEVWGEKNFEGDHLLIEGPAEYEALSSGVSTLVITQIFSLTGSGFAIALIVVFGAMPNKGQTARLLSLTPAKPFRFASDPHK